MDFMDKISKDLVEAMKSRDEGKELLVSVLRMAKSAVKNAEISKRGDNKELTTEDIIGVLSGMVKQRRDSAEQYEKANRKDLADKEILEIGVLQRYLPQQLSPEELDVIIREAIQSTGVKEMKDIGRLMKELMPKVKGKSDGKAVNQRIKEIIEQGPFL